MRQKVDRSRLRLAASSDTERRAARVVAVDDDPAMLVLLEETLVEAGFEVRCADTGAGAIEICDSFGPDLVLLDINMPGMDGIETCASLRRAAGQDFPIVMVTSVDDATSIQAAFEAGATDFIVKPINWPIFQRRLDSIMAEWRHAGQLDENRQRLAALQRVAPEQVMLVSRNGLIIEDLKDHSGVHRSGPLAAFPTLDEMYGPETATRFKQCISSVLKTCQPKSLRFTAVEWGRERDCQADFQVDGRDRVIVVIQTVTEDLSTPREIYELAFHDPATGLPNRHLFRRVAVNVIADALLHDRSLALFSLSIGSGESWFRDENLLRELAATLDRCVAEDPRHVPVGEQDGAAAVARGAGNEFLFMLDDVRTGAEVNSLLEKLRTVFDSESRDDGLHLEPAIGVAILPSDGNDPETLLLAAASARIEARTAGRFAGRHGSSVPVLEVLDYAGELREALEKDQLELHYQPRIDARSGSVTCAEALLRWNHPLRGYVGLDEILRYAKATGLIVEIGDRVLRMACNTVAGWPADEACRLSVNLSRQELLHPELAARLTTILSEARFDPGRLEIEVTEAALMRAEQSPSILASIKALGVGLVLDDFGTGHSSLATLKDLPLDALKIDRSFVARATEDSASAAICEIIAIMAHKMGLVAIAEGVETEAQFEKMVAIGCDELQGFLVSRPLDAVDLREFVAARQTGAN